MKKYYVTKMNKTIWFIIMFIAAAICGTLYALYMQQDNYDLLLALNACMTIKENDISHFEVFRHAFSGYLKQVGIVWAATLNPFTIPVVMLIFFLIVFSYAFTASCFIMMYGIKGIWIGFKLFGIQAAAIILLIIYIGSNNPIFKNGSKKDGKGSTINHIIDIAILLSVISIISLLDAYIFLFL